MAADWLLDLLVRLIEDFEDRHYQLNASTPAGILRELMEARGLGQKDLVGVFGSPSRVSEAVNGKRERDMRNGFAIPFRYSPRAVLDGALHPDWLLRQLRHQSRR